MYLYNEDYDTRALSGDTRTYHVGLNGEDRAYGLANGIDTETKTYTVQLENNEIQRDHLTTEYHTDIRDRTYYVKADGRSQHRIWEARWHSGRASDSGARGRGSILTQLAML